MNQDGATELDRLVEELRWAIAERERAVYSDVVLREGRAPKNVGRMADADWHGAVHGRCGDTMEIFLRVDDGLPSSAGPMPPSATIEKATFVTDGCGVTLACGSMLTQMVTGARLETAEWILPEDLIDALGGLPEESAHCAGLAVSTLQNALFNWRASQMEEGGDAE